MDGLKEEESIYVKLERPSLNRGGGLLHYLSTTYNTVLSLSPDSSKTIHTWAHLALQTTRRPFRPNIHNWPE